MLTGLDMSDFRKVVEVAVRRGKIRSTTARAED
jgi:hypothetical protein